MCELKRRGSNGLRLTSNQPVSGRSRFIIITFVSESIKPETAQLDFNNTQILH